LERELFTRAIQLAQDNQAKAARWLDVIRTTAGEADPFWVASGRGKAIRKVMTINPKWAITDLGWFLTCHFPCAGQFFDAEPSVFWAGITPHYTGTTLARSLLLRVI